MTTCNGRGECITFCYCGLYGCICWTHNCEDDNCMVNKCLYNCGHHSGAPGPQMKWFRQCGVYGNNACPNKCDIVECHNYKFCGQKRPQVLLDYGDGICPECFDMIGKIKFLNEKAECPKCHINKDIIEISCKNHKACLDCWKAWFMVCEKSPLPCILCSNG